MLKAAPKPITWPLGIVPGEQEHVISLGGMGISVSAYTQNAEAALDYHQVGSG